MATRDWLDVYREALAGLGAHAGRRVLRAGAGLVHALRGGRRGARSAPEDLSMFGGDFDASADALRPRVPDGLEVVEREIGRATIRILAIEHHGGDPRVPDRELAITTLVRHRGTPGELVLEMPLTIEAARRGRASSRGLPAGTLAEIRIGDDGRSRVCEVVAGGMHVLTLRVEPTFAFARAFFHDHRFDVRDGERVIARDLDGGGELGRSDDSGGATIELGEHAIAQALRALEIAETSLSHLVAPRVSATLGQRVDVGALSVPEPDRPRWIGVLARSS